MDKTWTELHGQLHPVGAADSSLQKLPAGENSPAAGIAGSKRSADRFSTTALQVSQCPDSLLIRLGPGRQKTMAAVVASCGLLFATVAAWLPDQGPGNWMFVGVLCVFALALLLVAGYLPFSAEEIRVDRSGISRLRFWSGLVISRRRVPTRSIRILSVESVAAIQNPERSYRLMVRGDCRSLCLLELPGDRLLLEALQRQILVAAGISRERLSG